MMKSRLLLFILILNVFFIFVNVLRSQTTYYVVREASSYYVVPHEKVKKIYEEVIPPREMSVVDKKTASYIELDDLLREPSSAHRKTKRESSYEKKVLAIQPPDESGLFQDLPKNVVYEVRDEKIIYGKDKEGRYWKKIGDLPKRWYICAICHKEYFKLYKIGDKWVCSRCWIKAYIEKNRKEKNYLMKNYP